MNHCSQKHTDDLRLGWIYFIFVFFASLLIAGALSPFVFNFVCWLKINHPDVLPSILEKRTDFSDFPRYFDRARWIVVLSMLPLLFRFCKINSFKDLGLTKNIFKPLFIGFGIGVLIIFISGIINFIGIGSEISERVIDFKMLGSVAFKSLFVALLVAVIEEFLFRGIILRLFLNGMRSLYAVFFASFFFAILHFTRVSWGDESITFMSGFVVAWKTFFSAIYTFEWVKFLNLFLVGIFLSFIFLKTKSLWYCIGIHSAWVFCFKLLDKIWDVGDNHFGAFLCYESLGTAMVMCIFIFVFMIKNKKILRDSTAKEDFSLSRM